MCDHCGKSACLLPPPSPVVHLLAVHPIEYVVGESFHLTSNMFLVWCGLELHVGMLVVYLLLAGALAGLNHTRFDLWIPPSIWDVRVHDVHHRIPTVNMGQYTMLWDRLFGMYRPYETPRAKQA